MRIEHTIIEKAHQRLNALDALLTEMEQTRPVPEAMEERFTKLMKELALLCWRRHGQVVDYIETADASDDD